MIPKYAFLIRLIPAGIARPKTFAQPQPQLVANTYPGTESRARSILPALAAKYILVHKALEMYRGLWSTTGVSFAFSQLGRTNGTTTGTIPIPMNSSVLSPVNGSELSAANTSLYYQARYNFSVGSEPAGIPVGNRDLKIHLSQSYN